MSCHCAKGRVTETISTKKLSDNMFPLPVIDRKMAEFDFVLCADFARLVV